MSALAQALGVISGSGTEDSTVANERSSLLCLSTFLAYKASQETIAAVDDDKDEDADIEEKLSEEEKSSGSGSGSSSAGGLATKSLSALAFETPSLLGTKLFWQQLAYFMVFVWEKKDGEAYKHGTAKSYYNCIHKLARNLVRRAILAGISGLSWTRPTSPGPGGRRSTIEWRGTL